MMDDQYAKSLTIYILLLIVLVIQAYFLYANYDNLDKYEVRAKYNIIYQNVSVWGKDRRTVLYLPFYLFKRWLLILIPVLVGDDNAL